ncbi:isopentenyl-diphosphate Delta-isomerase [Micromonospora olivasterospora]|uniref:Isopentenyl-diphosphate Delta-isomerase n=1 Tax=Micromonospora olivasterospora TaxID=1880 RepID=A0A562IG05_MICOL|nr:isopentenyl-diphosphate Delta-isomerase [Micromonospora olivasterospora]TWH69758.1 isopentenyl-diphosphate delta-isomerase [Micromonospora olivasterospora]
MELVVLLDHDGRAVGEQDKRTVHTDDTPLHLAFSCYVFSSSGRFLMSRRSLRKRTWPGIWTNSFCGHPGPGEPVTDAVHRRAQAELGLTLSDLHLVLPRFRYRAELDGVVENEMCPVYVAQAAGDPVPNPDEVDQVEWVGWDSFRERTRTDETLSPWCRLQIDELPEIGPVPGRWPVGDAAELPPAARAAVAGRG